MSTLSSERGGDPNLNGLQILSRPLPGEPYYPFGILDTKSVVQSNDNYKSILDIFPGYKISNNNIADVDKLISHTGQSNTTSWSQHDLPTRYGGIAYRYLDSFLSDSSEDLKWEDLFQDYLINTSDVLINNFEINILSPIEKYEYLIGNTNFSMTKNQWQEGSDYLDQFGIIPSWIGMCHGSAPATFKSPRPLNAITLKSFNGLHDITFYPSDIKDLLTYAWATNTNYSGMIGRRCGSVVYYGQRPSVDCLDPNPSSFHLAVLNLLGLNQQSFIIDTSAGNEVWNRTIKSYRYKYFRPGTHNFTDKLEFAQIPIDAFKNDPYFMYRSTLTTKIVGVWMELTYIVATKPSDSITDSAENDIYGVISYWYDLEIDQDGNIIGGEWQNEHHPDFLWVVGDDVQPKSFYDYIIGSGLNTYDGNEPLPPSITGYAKQAARKNQILYSILEGMLKLSRI